MTWSPDIIIYHDKCIDGFTAAWACHLRWPDADLYADNYGHGALGRSIDLADFYAKRILIVDFSYPSGTLVEFVSVWGAHSVIVLDHHKSAQAELEIFARFKDNPKRFTLDVASSMIEDMKRGEYNAICALFDMERSGAGLAWDFAHRGKPRPRLVDLVEDRDLWRFAYGDDSRHLNLALSSGPMDFQRWDAAAEATDDFIRQGGSIAAYRDTLIEEIVQRAWRSEIDGKEVITVDCPYLLVSEAGHRLLELHPTAQFAALRVADQHAITFSLRSADDREDVSAVARKFGGGGHRNAAGFRVPR